MLLPRNSETTCPPASHPTPYQLHVGAVVFQPLEFDHQTGPPVSAYSTFSTSRSVTTAELVQPPPSPTGSINPLHATAIAAEHKESTRIHGLPRIIISSVDLPLPRLWRESRARSNHPHSREIHVTWHVLFWLVVGTVLPQEGPDSDVSAFAYLGKQITRLDSAQKVAGHRPPIGAMLSTLPAHCRGVEP